MTERSPEEASEGAGRAADGFAEAVVLVLGRVKNALEKKPADRDNYIEALLALTELVKSLAGIKAGQRLLDLVYVLSDLNSGIVSNLLKPSVPQRGAKPSVFWAQQAQAALALECLVRAGISLDEAASVLARGRKFTAATLINWRKEFRADRVSNKVGQAIFANGLTRIDQIYPRQLPELAKGFMSVVMTIEQEQDF